MSIPVVVTIAPRFSIFRNIPRWFRSVPRNSIHLHHERVRWCRFSARPVAACTTQPVAFNEYPSTRGCLTGLINKPRKSRPVNLWLWCWDNNYQLACWYRAIDLWWKTFFAIVCVSSRFWQIWSQIMAYGPSKDPDLQRQLPSSSL